MRKIGALLLLVVALAACSQNPFTPPFNPAGSWSGTWSGNGNTVSLSATIIETASGWQATFSSNGENIVTVCVNPDDEGPNYLYCGAWSYSEVIVWEGNVSGSTWSGVWTYVGPSLNAGGTFSLTRH